MNKKITFIVGGFALGITSGYIFSLVGVKLKIATLQKGIVSIVK